MPGSGIEQRSRQLEIFLDAVVMYASGDRSWLLDPDFSFLLNDNERQSAAAARDFAASLRQFSPGSSWAALADELDRFGANSQPGGAAFTERRGRS